MISDRELSELQELEYSLWKLHYRNIDEFRKKLKKSSGRKMTTPQNLVTQESIDDYVKGLKSFLDEATKYYKSLLVKIKRYYDLPEEFSFYTLSGISTCIEPKRLRRLQFLCHRLLVCLGDLARYREQYGKENTEHHEWSAAVSHYLEASVVWPDGGNPQNQLAVLATYVGDEFLALYHCIRSLAVKEPFPDAWNNLILLFERNRSVNLCILSADPQFDPLNRYERISQLESASPKYLVKTECDESREKSLWLLLIRLVGFFFIEFSLEDFCSTFATTLQELDALMSLDNEKLKAALEPYQRMDSARRGPFRAIQIVSIFIFVIDRLITSPVANDSKNKDGTKQIMLIQMALTTTFICMGCVAGRCLKGKVSQDCFLLPALLVFAEWLSSILEKVETYMSNDKSKSAVAYFFHCFLEVLKQLELNTEESSGSIALWEDHELRGFRPLACSHSSLGFSTGLDYAESFETGAHHRTHRIVNAALKIINTPAISQKWILYNNSAGRFYAADSNGEMLGKVEPDTSIELKEPSPHNSVEGSEKSVEEEEELILQKPSGIPGKHVLGDDDEVILFKPLTRHNSAPLSSTAISDQSLQTDTDEQMVPAEERLRRATSLLIAQNIGSQQETSVFPHDLSNFQYSQQVKDQEPRPAFISLGPPSLSSSSAGPPSLNAWVLNRGNYSKDRTKGKKDKVRRTLTPIDEISSSSFSDLFIGETRDPTDASKPEPAKVHFSPPAYTAPVPSAPLLPNDAIWFNGNQSTFSDFSGLGRNNATNGFLDVVKVAGNSNWNGSHQPHDYTPLVPGPVHGYQQSRPMTSFEWLRQFRENSNHQQVVNHTRPVYSALGNNGNFYGYDLSGFGPFDYWGAPLAANLPVHEQNTTVYLGLHPVYIADDNRRMDKVFYGYQRSSPYVCGAVREPEPLLQVIKEKEWIIQQDPTFGGSTHWER